MAEENKKENNVKKSVSKLCKYCGQEIPKNAHVCYHCSRGLTWKVKLSLPNIITLTAMGATIAAAFILLCSIRQNDKNLEIQRDNLNVMRSSLEIYQEQTNLQLRALEQVDSSLNISIAQLIAQNKANELNFESLLLTKESIEQEHLQYIKDNEPNLFIRSKSCEIDNENLKYIYSIMNKGNSLAQDILDGLEYHDLTANKQLYMPPRSIEPLPGGTSVPSINFMPLSNDIIIKISLKWHWEYNNQNYSDDYYRHIEYDPEAEKPRVRQISKDEYFEYLTEHTIK